MNDFNRSFGTPNAVDVGVDTGVRSFMLGVYNKLALGIALAGVLAFVAGTFDPLRVMLFETQLRWVVMLAPPAILIFANFGMRNPSPVGSNILYWAVVISMGLSMGIYFAMAELGLGGMSHMVITKAFLLTAATFAGLSLFGYTTKRDLGPIGSFAFMAIWGLFLVSMVSFVLPMIFPGLSFLAAGGTFGLIVSGGFALLSAVIIAWQTQSLKEGYYYYAQDARALSTMTSWGALNFFVTFVNIFTFFLRLMADD